jgi:hypothetical protein
LSYIVKVEKTVEVGVKVRSSAAESASSIFEASITGDISCPLMETGVANEKLRQTVTGNMKYASFFL